MNRKLIVTHHAPDLDAIGASWLLKTFDAQHYGNAKFAFVNPGSTIKSSEVEKLEIDTDDVTHVDTGLGKFDHHQPERGHDHSSAASLVFEYLCQIHPDLEDDHALDILVDFITEIDHFGEIYWPEADHDRYNFMLHEIIRGLEFVGIHNDESQLHFGFTCLDGIYSALKQHVKAKDILKNKAEYFQTKLGKCMAVETKNDDTLKLAQKYGAVIAIRKDSSGGHIRIKARPDAELDLKDLADEIKLIDSTGTWYYHPSGKMLINGSRKHRQQKASPLSLEQVIELVKKVYGN
ncbi:MAG: hypothetical protein HN846_02190 [Candidatus Pacebacteria bacterium]|jgi:hypothetical protein|nr:hypothetical protein [Candidatus Paceibacterota bacterium]MBT3511726.1 hypothetical protein [Candidatus Paceibacterota bacterium]MBT4005155.1 hypothetical protein [Candidatus Paceibacterota bacterium]MBT4358612.1 hypothetical protein [Candidatus Paceibacterota bacterium]MBT4680752.1 hypothetical protein [Candidatus Paceibacterota bacterium]